MEDTEAYRPEGVPIHTVWELRLLPGGALRAGYLIVALVGEIEKV
jgi:hypothetical protein